MKPLLIIKTGTKLPSLAPIAGDYEHWIAGGMDWPTAALMVVDVAAAETLPAVAGVGAVAITGSGAMVTDGDDWMERSAEWLRSAAGAGLPILGICFGHQLLAHALGGHVGNNPNGIEVGSKRITLTLEAESDPLFTGLPQAFAAQLSHTQSVLQLPPQARLLASSAMEPHQAFAWGRCVWGIQFHPEFDTRITPHFIDYYREKLLQQGTDPEQLQQQIVPTPHSQALLRRFAELARSAMESA